MTCGATAATARRGATGRTPTSPRGRAPETRPGFTLIEVVVVLFLLGLAAAIVGPALGRGVEAIRGRAEVSGFAAFLRHGREQAIVRREPHEVRVDPVGRALVLTARGPDNVRASRPLSARLHVEPVPPSGLVVRFLPDGISTGGTFRLGTADGRAYLVTVDPLTGRVQSRRETE